MLVPRTVAMTGNGEGACRRIAGYVCLSLAASIGNDRKGALSIVVYAAAIPLSFVRPWIAFACYFMVAVMWLLPDPRIEKTIGQ